MCGVTFILFALFVCLHVCTGTMHLSSDGRFNDFLIYISDNIPEQDGGNMVNNIKAVMTATSRLLYNATELMTNRRQRISFGEVHIRVPRSWKMVADPITWQQCVKSEFKVVTKLMASNSDVPFTIQRLKCGDPGDFSTFTDSFFSVDGHEEVQIKSKQVMREFAKLRYGVFSEEPFKKALYEFDGKGFVQSSCPASIKWDINQPNKEQCSDYNNTCTYKIVAGQSHVYSVMFDTDTATTAYFCNDDTTPHNKYAKSLHNRKCKRSSVSNVILRHKDYKTGFNQARYGDPLFRIVKAQSRKIVLVLDTSGSMFPVIDKTKKALAHFINFTIEDGADLGIVVFSSTAFIKSQLLTVDSSTRQTLVQIIEGLVVYGQTNMGAGLMRAVEVLGGNIMTNDRIYGTIILLSDGENNEEDEIDYQLAINNTITKGIVTYAISYGDSSDPHLMRLAKGTGGMFLHAAFNSTESELFSKFTIQKSCDTSERRQVKAIEGRIQIDTSNSIFNFSYIDSFIGENSVINVDFARDVTNMIIRLIDPQGLKYEHTEKTINKDVTTLIFKIPGKPVSGMYKLQITSIRTDNRYRRSTSTVPLTYQISGTPSGRVYNPESTLSTTSIDVVRDNSSVTVTIDMSSVDMAAFEHVNVSMTMTYPSMSSIHLTMTDDGLGDDSIEGDHIFTRTIYARSLTEKGFYQFQGHVTMMDAVNKVTIRRTVEVESLRIHKMRVGQVRDRVPPASIEDMRVVSIDVAEGTVVIEFTAPGDDSMSGRIARYEVLVTRLWLRVRRTSNSMTVFYHACDPYTKIRRRIPVGAMDEKRHTVLRIRGVDTAGNGAIWSPSVYIKAAVNGH